MTSSEIKISDFLIDCFTFMAPPWVGLDLISGEFILNPWRKD